MEGGMNSVIRNTKSPRSQQKFILHPLIHTFATSESSTKYCSSFFRGKVWIKVSKLSGNQYGL